MTLMELADIDEAAQVRSRSSMEASRTWDGREGLIDDPSHAEAGIASPLTDLRVVPFRMQEGTYKPLQPPPIKVRHDSWSGGGEALLDEPRELGSNDTRVAPYHVLDTRRSRGENQHMDHEQQQDPYAYGGDMGYTQYGESIGPGTKGMKAMNADSQHRNERPRSMYHNSTVNARSYASHPSRPGPSRLGYTDACPGYEESMSNRSGSATTSDVHVPFAQPASMGRVIGSCDIKAHPRESIDGGHAHGPSRYKPQPPLPNSGGGESSRRTMNVYQLKSQMR